MNSNKVLFCTQLLMLLTFGSSQFTWVRTFNSSTMLRVPMISWNRNYTTKVQSLQNYTLDEKCEKGLGIGVAFQIKDPYVRIGRNGTFFIAGMFPHLLRTMLQKCCPESQIEYGRFLASIHELEQQYNEGNSSEVDISFPAYGHREEDGKVNSDFRGFPFVPLVTAPKIAVLVHHHFFNELRVNLLLKTIFDSWPLLVFILFSACLAGMIMWILDRKKNREEFPKNFLAGTWEGIWCAFITMTTVGYGDCAPKSILTRLFCMIWILLGVVIISLFTGLVASAVQRTSSHGFNIHGTPIGAIRGSAEYQLGVGLNADMRSYDNVYRMIAEDLVTTSKLHAAMIDNFILSANMENLVKQGIHVEQEFAHPVTYGAVLGPNSSKVETCFRKYKAYNPHQVFEIIADKLVPLSKDSRRTLREGLEAAMVNQFFYKEPIFKTIMYVLMGVLLVVLFIGIVNEYVYKLNERLQSRVSKIWNNQKAVIETAYSSRQSLKRYISLLVGSIKTEGLKGDEVDDEALEQNEKSKHANLKLLQLQNLVQEYEEFHHKWITRVKKQYGK